MIDRIRINNFKCFREQSFDIKKLNVFCGPNGVGKSSCIQAFLIAREVYQCADTPIYVKLNNLFKQDLGQVLDIFHNSATNEQVSFEFHSGERSIIISAPVGSARAEERFLQFDAVPESSLECFVSRMTGYFTYLSPERDGPRDIQPIQSAPLDCLQIGTSGEYTAEVLATYERMPVREGLQFVDQSGSKLPDQLQPQLERWTNEIFPNIQLKPVTSPGTNAVGVRIKKGGIEAEWLKPTNIGFGISYCLPMLLGGLLGREEGLFIIDSPEAHLHPASQSKIANFLCQVANANTQVVVETHSDHILHGIRLAVAKGVIPPEDVRIHYLSASDEGVLSEQIAVKKDGSLSKWPAGFFDQTEKDLAEIVKSKRRAT
jgi:predicted ATPase